MGAPTPVLPTPSQAEAPGSPRTPEFLSCCSPVPTLQELPKPHVLSSSGTNHLSCLHKLPRVLGCCGDSEDFTLFEAEKQSPYCIK